jgi:hypothetical protein
MRRQGIILLILLILCLNPNSLQGQNLFTGYVKNTDGTVVVNASVKLKDSEKTFIRFFNLTDQDGKFVIRLPEISKRYIAECSFIGYKTYTYTFETMAGNKTALSHNIVLIRDTAVLPEIHVTAVPPIKVSGDTTTFRTDAFRLGNESNVSDLLNNIPGFSVENGRIKYNGRAVNRVLLGGDDLFGQDYTTITQNLMPRGIDKIELIDNYDDKTYLSNRLRKGKELVVNLNFDKKFLYKVIGSHEMGTDAGFSYYKVRQNLVSLIPKIKFVTTTNFNNTGLLGAALSGDMTGIPALAAFKKDGINFDLQPRSPASPIAQMPDIGSQIVPKEKIVFNRSQFVSNNLLYKPSKTITVKNIIQYYRDAYHQQQFRKEEYIIPGSAFTVSDQQWLQKKIPFVNISNEIIYTITPKIQLVYKLNYSGGNEYDSSSGIRQSVYPINSSLSFTNHNFQQQIGLSYMLDTNKLVDVRAYQSSFKSRQEPAVFPAVIFTPLTGDSSFPTISTLIDDDQNNYLVQAKLQVKKRRSIYLLEAFYTKSICLLNSSASLYGNGSFSPLTDPSMVNRSALNTETGSFLFDITQTFNEHYVLHLGQKIEKGSLFLTNANAIGRQKKYVNYLPSAELRIRINDHQNIALRWGMENKLPRPYDVFFSNIITSGSEVVKGVNELNTGLSNQVTLTYSYTNAVRQKLVAYAALSYAREPLMYLVNSFPGLFYTLNNKFSFPGNGTSWNIFGSVSKYVSGIRSQLSGDVSAVFHDTYYAANNMIGNFGFRNISTKVKCKTLVTDKLITTLGSQAIFFSQVFNEGTATSMSRYGHTFNNTAAVTYRFSGGFSFTGSYREISQALSSGKHRLALCDFSVNYLFRKGVVFNLAANNLFGSGSFATTGYTQLSTVTQSIDLFPAYVMLSATIDF